MTDANRIGIYIPDATYGREEYKSTRGWEEASATFKTNLEKEFGTSFEYESLPGGVDFPSYSTFFDLWPQVVDTLELLYRGAEVTVNLAGLWEIYHRVKPFLKRRPVLDRKGALAVAYGKAREKLGKAPSKLRVRGYAELVHEPKPETTGEITEIEEARKGPPFPFATHALQIEADQRGFRVYVGNKVKIIELKPAKPRRPTIAKRPAAVKSQKSKRSASAKRKKHKRPTLRKRPRRL